MCMRLLMGPTLLFIKRCANMEYESLTGYESEDEDYCLNIMEPYFIRLYNAVGKRGYNISEGGNCGPRLRGKFNPMYGRTHTNAVKSRLSEMATRNFKGKSYNELYGFEKSIELKKIRSEKFREYRTTNSLRGSNNPNFDAVSYKFLHKDGYIFRGTMFTLREHDCRLTKENTSRLKCGGLSKGWKLVAASWVEQESSDYRSDALGH